MRAICVPVAAGCRLWPFRGRCRDSETAEGQARVESFVRALLGLNGPASLYPSVSHCYLCILFPQCITTEKWDQTGKSRMHRGNY